MTHGMPCVNMHAHHEGYKYGHGQLISWSSSFSPWEQQGGGGREKEKEEEEKKGRKGKEEGRKGEEKGKKKREEERGGKEEKKKEEEEGVLRSEQTRTEKNPELRYKR